MQPEPSHFDLVVARLETFVDTAVEFLPVLGIAVVVVVLSWIVARLVTRGEALFRFVDNQLARDLARQVVRKAIVIAGLIIALEILDATALIGAVLGAAGVLGIAVGFAFRDLVENYIAGILLSLRQPFARDDAVVINEHAGKVVRLTPRATRPQAAQTCRRSTSSRRSSKRSGRRRGRPIRSPGSAAPQSW
jgi:small-conductance mechanosensitive channel